MDDSVTFGNFCDVVADSEQTAHWNQRLFSALADAYGAIANRDFQKWQNALEVLRDLPKDDFFTARVADLHATICDLNHSDELSMITSDICAALDPFPIRFDAR